MFSIKRLLSGIYCLKIVYCFWDLPQKHRFIGLLLGFFTKISIRRSPSESFMKPQSYGHQNDPKGAFFHISYNNFVKNTTKTYHLNIFVPFFKKTMRTLTVFYLTKSTTWFICEWNRDNVCHIPEHWASNIV